MKRYLLVDARHEPVRKISPLYKADKAGRAPHKIPNYLQQFAIVDETQSRNDVWRQAIEKRFQKTGVDTVGTTLFLLLQLNFGKIHVDSQSDELGLEGVTG